jgi:recombination protein RecA
MAKSKETASENKGKFQEALDKLNKTYGVGTVLTLDNNNTESYDVISTGSIGFDNVTLGVGGFVKGKLYELMGWEGCLAEDTYIKFINVRPDGIVQDCKGGTIKNLYERFHNRSEETKNTIFNVTSINEHDRVFRNQIADVVKSGVKECFEVITKKGFKIKATKDHKFYSGESYIPLEKLKVGDIVFVHNNTSWKCSKKRTRSKYEETTMKWYYKGNPRKINGFDYFREKIHRLVFEANMNNMTYDKYKEMLNSGITSLPNNFWTIPEEFDIHHIDENTKNNDISNLQLIQNSEHAKLHALNNHNNLRFVVVEDEIVSIKSVGNMETYDIKCYFPYNNFIAEGIVVHNSGKSTICGHVVAECQKAGGVALYIDGEHAVDKKYFQAIGVDTTKMLIAQPSCGEEGFNIAMEMINSGTIDLVIIDSDSSLIPKKVLDGDVGDSSIGKKALLNSNAYPKLKTALSEHNVCVIVVSQYREKIGVMFGNPTTTQGGHALKFYSDCRIEVSKSLAKDGDVNYGNITKIKAIKNKMSPPYRLSQFEIVYGVGIDKLKEIMELASDFEIIKKWGKTITFGETKYDVEEFKAMLLDNEEFYNSLKSQIINKINNTEIKTETDESTSED